MCVCIKQSVTTEMAIYHICNIPISLLVCASQPKSKRGEGEGSLFGQNISLLNEHREGQIRFMGLNPEITLPSRSGIQATMHVHTHTHTRANTYRVRLADWNNTGGSRCLHFEPFLILSIRAWLKPDYGRLKWI